MKSSYRPRFLIAVALTVATVLGANEIRHFPTNAPIPYLSPEEQVKTFELQPGYALELVIADPIIREPTIAAFDGDGRMFVAEMRTYMQDIDGRNQHTAGGRISLHWSSKGNGVYDKHTVFADNLILPRMILPVANGLLVNETDTNDIWLFSDTDNDGVSDRKTRVFEGGKRGGNLEHQQSGLIWNLDNWLYMTVNDFRLRIHGTGILKEPTPQGGGQWGLSRDDYGKPWFVNAGGEIGPLHFQQPYLYGRFSIKGELAPGYREVFPLVGIPDVEGGKNRFRPDSQTLNHLTAACGGEIFRGDRLPADLRGDLLYAEPVGRLIRRTKIEVKNGVTYLSNPYQEQKSEFIRSTDPNFRPVNLVTAPDGTLYIVDMYRGIIQEGNWVRPGTYLRGVVQQYQLEKNYGRGRIWRLVHKDLKPGKQPKLQESKSAKLVEHLQHPNGWWRDTAQKLLVLRQDISVVPALANMAQKNRNHLARIHALWTLEGLNRLDPSLVREKLNDEHPQVRIAAIRASETLYKDGNQTLVPPIKALANDRDPSVVIQTMLTANFLQWENAKDFIEATMKNYPALGVQEVGARLLTPQGSEGRELTASDRNILRRGEGIYNELCFACHGPDGKGMPLQGAAPGTTMAPPLSGSKTVLGLSDHLINVMLKGLTGPVHGKTYDAQMVAMDSNDDAWIAAVTSYVRNSFGNEAPFITTNEVARVRATFKERGQPWTMEELIAVSPQPLTNRQSWVVTASHYGKSARLAVDGKPETRYETATEQVPGMWYQVELPQETSVCGLLLDATASPRDYPRGFEIKVSSDGKTWTGPVAAGRGNSRVMEIRFQPTNAKFVRVTQTGSVNGLFWSIHELQVLQPPDPAKIKAAVAKGVQTSTFE